MKYLRRIFSILMFGLLLIIYPHNVRAMNVNIQDAAGNVTPYNVETSTIVNDLITNIKNNTGITNSIVISYKDNLLENGKTLADYAINENDTLNYIIQTYTIKFDSSFSEGYMKPVSGLTGEYTLPENKFYVPFGKQFKGWSYSRNGKIITTVLPTDLDGALEKTVFAVWEDIPVDYTYTFISGDNQEFYESTFDEYTFEVSGDAKLLESITIGEIEFTLDDYKVINLTPVVTFTNSGIDKLNSLPVGTHEIKVVYKNKQTITGNLNIKDFEIPVIEETKKEEVKVVPVKKEPQNNDISKAGCVLFLTGFMAFYIFIIKK